MANVKRSITVMDCRNSTFYEKGKEFKVVKMTNTISYEVDQYLSAGTIQQIISGGTKVDVIPYKR